MIDNIDLIKPLLNFENDGDFYMLYVFKRKKDQATDKANHQSVRTIKTYVVESIDYLEKRYDEIKQLCEMFNARAYIHIQKQNHKDVSLDMLVALAEKIKNGQHVQTHLFDSVVGQMKIYEKRWIIDIDTKSIHIRNMIMNIIESVRPNDNGSKVEAIIPTKNGVHLITSRFDVMEFSTQLTQRGEVVPDIQKKNPTLLYLPNTLDIL
jgi:hypothetical protein